MTRFAIRLLLVLIGFALLLWAAWPLDILRFGLALLGAVVMQVGMWIDP